MPTLEAARSLSLGIECLRASGLLPVSLRSIQDAAGSVRVATDDQRLGNALTSVGIYAIVVELVVKHLWEKEFAKAAKPTHNVHKLFLELQSDTKDAVKPLYDECSGAYKAAMQEGQKQLGVDVVSVDMATLEDALDWNSNAIRNFRDLYTKLATND